MTDYSDFDRYMAERGLGIEDAPQAFADWLTEKTGEPVVGMSAEGVVQGRVEPEP